MKYKITAFDRTTRVWVSVKALFIKDGRITNIQTNAGVYSIERFDLEIDLDLSTSWNKERGES